MSEANDLIERLERATGQRIDANDGNNLALAGLFGAISRIMGKLPATYTERDDVAAGVLIHHQMTPEYKRKQESKAILIGLLSPDDLGYLPSKEPANKSLVLTCRKTARQHNSIVSVLPYYVGKSMAMLTKIQNCARNHETELYQAFLRAVKKERVRRKDANRATAS